MLNVIMVKRLFPGWYGKSLKLWRTADDPDDVVVVRATAL
jgi:hypothetical protein